jgi:hypothetical protein
MKCGGDAGVGGGRCCVVRQSGSVGEGEKGFATASGVDVVFVGCDECADVADDGGLRSGCGLLLLEGWREERCDCGMVEDPFDELSEAQLTATRLSDERPDDGRDGAIARCLRHRQQRSSGVGGGRSPAESECSGDCEMV